ncbi:MAG: ABC transporter ATP-binding protein [Alphaproteobacteria bacterium]
MSTIELKGVTKRFGELTAVDNIDLFVDAGEVVCLLGPSGCGKTTVLRMISGLEEVSEGEVLVDGRMVADLAARDRNVAMAFQFYALYPSLSVRENLKYPLHAEKLSKAEIDTRVDKVADLLHLREIIERTPDQLAEGEKQRVAVGRAIIREPNCFLFDEPLSRLDVELREQMRAQIKEVLSKLNKATLIVTHDQLEALTMADRIVVMRAGRIEQIASPHDLFSRPANLFVAGFIGTPEMNLIPATSLGVTERGLNVEIADRRFFVGQAPGWEGFAKGTALTLGFRPRSATIAQMCGGDTLPATIDLIEPLGPENLIHFDAGGLALRVVLSDDREFLIGEQLNLQVHSSDILLFDEQENLVSS